MQSLILFCTLFQAIYLGAADEKLNYDQDGGINSVLLKKILDLEERDREFDRKVQVIEVLKERLDEAQKRLENMRELEYRLQKAEEQIRVLIKCADSHNAGCKLNKSATKKVLDTNITHFNIDIGSSVSTGIKSAVSSMEVCQTEIGEKHAERVSFKNFIKIVQNMTPTKDIKRTVTRTAAFTAMFSSTPVAILPGHSLIFDRVEYNEGNAYDPTIGIFTCPVSGTYLFFTSVLSDISSGQVQTEIVVNGLGKVKTLAFQDADHAQGSTAAALHCNAGQRVWVQGAYGSKAYGLMFSSFTGILLWPDDAAANSN